MDFSSENSFAQTEQALREQSEIEVPHYTTDKINAQICGEAKAPNSRKPDSVTATAAQVPVSEVDGSMRPIINTEPPEDAADQDLRKHRKCHRKELRVSTVSNPDLADTYYRGTPGEPLVVGCMMLEYCQFNGMTPQTRIHAVLDRARWITGQYELHFGTQ